VKVSVLRESGYEEAVLGFSLSYNSTIDRTKQILPKYAFGVPGEGKFLESIFMWIDVTASTKFWVQADTYRISTKQSESQMHTLSKKVLTNEHFEYPLPDSILDYLNESIEQYKRKEIDVEELTCRIPQGYKYRRVWVLSYKTLQNMYWQRKSHKLKSWKYFLETVLSQLEHPEFIVKDYNKGDCLQMT